MSRCVAEWYDALCCAVQLWTERIWWICGGTWRTESGREPEKRGVWTIEVDRCQSASINVNHKTAFA